MKRKWLTIAEVVERSGFSRKDIDRAVTHGTLKSKNRTPGSRLRHLVVREDWLEEWPNTPDDPAAPPAAAPKPQQSKRRIKKPNFGDARELIAAAKQ